jgi:hypothetical protein
MRENTTPCWLCGSAEYSEQLVCLGFINNSKNIVFSRVEIHLMCFAEMTGKDLAEDLLKYGYKYASK